MGVSSSRIEDDKPLVLCRQRKHFVRQALDGRCSLAAAHVSYIQCLRNTGTALRKFVEPEPPVESSLYTSTSATPEPLGLTDKSASQFSNSSPSHSQHVDTSELFSPVPSPPYSGRFHVNYMKSGGNTTTIIERPPISVTATVQSSSDAPPNPTSHSDDTSTFDAPPPPPGTPPWDYFGLFNPIDNQFSFQDGRALNHGLDDVDDIKRLREEEGIPELEEEEEKTSSHGSSEYLDSEDEFDQPSTEPLVRIFKNRNEDLDSHSTNGTVDGMAQTTEQQNREKTLLTDGVPESDRSHGTPDTTNSKATTAMVTHLINVKREAEKEPDSENKLAAKDLVSSVKEIEYLFLKASESGKEVPIMLEANKVHFRPLVPEGKAHRSKASTFFTACLVCCKEEAQVPQEPVPNETKYLTWHRSVSSRSSSSRNPLGANSKDDVNDISNSLFSGICMNSGSHASTLDRLYAWERKLYDEVKASGIIRREYDMKCKLLRQQDSKGESSYKIDKTRATVKDLHSRIRVAIHRIDSISKRIEELRDKELQPQLEELIGGLTRMWVMMLECHKLQYCIMSISYNNGSSKVSVPSESHRQATILLENELSFLCSSFTKWIDAHKSYLQAINGWLRKCVDPVSRQKSSRRKNAPLFCPRRDLAPPIYITCQDWLDELEKLPTKEVADAIRHLTVETTLFLPRQDKNHGHSKLTFSLSWKAGNHELVDDIQRNKAPVDWSMGFDRWQEHLEVLLKQLKTFAEKSVNMYGNLGKAISEARNAYEHAGTRM